MMFHRCLVLLIFFGGCTACERQQHEQQMREGLKKKLAGLEKEEVYSAFREGSLAPDDVLIDYNGVARGLSTLQAKLTIIDFWASWCAPCYEAIPYYLDIANEYSSEDVRFLLVSIEDDSVFWREEVKANDWVSNSFWIGDKSFGNSLVGLTYEQFGEHPDIRTVVAIPHYVVLAESGEILLNTVQASPKYENFRSVIDSLYQSI